jgi:integrase/recombinase XerC
MSNLRPQSRHNSGDSVFGGVPVGAEEVAHLGRFLEVNDFSPNTCRAFRQDLEKFARWFQAVNGEPFRGDRTTARDVQDFRDNLRRIEGQAISTVNRALVTVRRFFTWLVEEGHASHNPAKKVKELRRQQLAPQGLDGKHIRRLLREVELREDTRAEAIFTLFLYTGCRCGDAVGLELSDLVIGERSGQVTFKSGKGRKERRVPLPIQARRSLQAYLQVRPPMETTKVFVGERGPLTDRGIRNLFEKYSAILGVKIHPHLLRHSMAHQFLRDNQNDLVSLAQILGHESLNTTARYTRRSQDDLAKASENLSY